MTGSSAGAESGVPLYLLKNEPLFLNLLLFRSNVSNFFFISWLLEVKLTGALSFAEEGDLVPSDEEVEETEGDLEMGLVKVGAWVGLLVGLGE